MFTRTLKGATPVKSSYPRQPLSQAALLGLAAAALLCAQGASAQALSGLNFQVTNATASVNGNPVESVTDDLTFNNLVLTETFSDGFSTPIFLPNLDTGLNFYAETPATLLDPTHGGLTSAVLTGTLGRDGFLPTSVLEVSLQLSPGGPLIDQFISSAFSTTLDLSGPFSSAPAGSISVGQFALFAGNNPLLNSAPTEIIVAPAVPEASTVVSMGLMLALGLGGLAVTRRRHAAK